MQIHQMRMSEFQLMELKQFLLPFILLVTRIGHNLQCQFEPRIMFVLQNIDLAVIGVIKLLKSPILHWVKVVR